MNQNNCPFCEMGKENKTFMTRDGNTTDIHVQVGRLSPRALIAKHWDIEGDTYDEISLFPINFCPMCGRMFEPFS